MNRYNLVEKGKQKMHLLSSHREWINESCNIRKLLIIERIYLRIFIGYAAYTVIDTIKATIKKRS